MHVDLVLSSIRQILDDRRLFEQYLEQARVAFGSGSPCLPPLDTPIDLDVKILPDDTEIVLSAPDEAADIQIVDEAPSEPLTDGKPADTLSLVEKAAPTQSAGPVPTEPPPQVEASEATLTISAQETIPEGPQISIDSVEFDENWAEARVGQIKRQIESNIQRIKDLQTAQTQSASGTGQRRDALARQFDALLGNLSQGITEEVQRHQNKQRVLDGQIDQERRRIRVASQSLLYRLLRWLGLKSSDAAQMAALSRSKQEEDNTHALLVRSLQETFDQTAAKRQEQLDSMAQAYRDEQTSLADQLRQAYQETAQKLIPEAQGILADWLDYLATKLRQWHPDWDDPLWTGLTPEYLMTEKAIQNPGLRVGTLICEDTSKPIPAVLDPLGNLKHILIQGGDSGKRGALERDLLLRLLLASPVGLTRVLLIDGVALGHTLRLFGTKLHKDICGEKVYDLEAEIAQQMAQVRQRISQINQHVLVEHDSIDGYNQANPDMPSPYLFIVINEFPSGFSGPALRAFEDIARNGPRAGVFVLATMTESSPRPQDFDLNRLYSQSYVFKLGGDSALQWNSEYLDKYRVRADTPLPDAATSSILDVLSRAYASKPVILDYARIRRDLPAQWSQPTATSMRAPIGLTFGGKLHSVEFSDEFVHGLIGGRPGSGKTILLHDLICGLAHLHAPDELELFLLDFKGTEFNIYAKNRLPHARVVAVDCDVDIGLSIIKRLGQEMDRRRKLFDDANVPDIRHYRERGLKLPRILLIIDEIQVMMQSLETALQRQVEGALIDLLRRGRAAGIHVLLATQSPSQVFSSQMLQQMAIRVCLLADQHVSRLVLGETNEAASGLQRQGEAVYNAYNGEPDKNVFIRTAMLEQDAIADMTRRLAEQARERGYRMPEDLLYFDGRSRSTLLDAEPVKRVLSGGTGPVSMPYVSIPLGNSIEIKEDTAARFARERYSNLVVVGGEGEQSHILLRNVILGLCILLPVDSAAFYVVDLTHESMPFAEAMLAFRAMPYPFQFARNSQLGVDLIAEVYREFEARKQQSKEGKQAPKAVYLAISSMENFTDLRGEDKFNPPEMRKKFEQMVADGPSMGIHTIVGTQTVAKGLILKVDDFGSRVCFQAAEDDSRALLDSDSGSKIMRTDRAIFRRRDWPYGKVEKFKPYLPPSEDHIRHVVDMLAKRGNSGDGPR